MAKEIKMHFTDVCICECGIVDNKDGGLRPTHHLSVQRIYQVVAQWERFNNVDPSQRLTVTHDVTPFQPYIRTQTKSFPAPNVSKQQVFEWVLKKQEELRETYSEYERQQAYILQHGNLNGYDGTSECAVCGATLTGEAKTAQYAYANGEEGRKIHHLHVGNTHFCNLHCFEKYKAKYNQQLITPKYDRV